MDIVQVNAERRESFGKKATLALRKEGRIPAVLYSKANGVQHFSTTIGDVKQIVYTPEFKLANIAVGDHSAKALLKDIVFHPVTDEIEHIDFLELVDGQALRADIPVHFKGISPGVKSGGKLIRTLRYVKIKTTPESIVDRLYVDISGLKLGDAVRVRDLEVPEGVQILVEGATPIANVEVPRAMKSASAKAEGAVVSTDEEAGDEEAEA